MLAGFPFGRFMAVLAAIKNDRDPNPEDIKVIDDWRINRLIDNHKVWCKRRRQEEKERLRVIQSLGRENDG